MKIKLWSAFLASTVLAALATFGFSAHAFARRQGAMNCITDPQQKQSAWQIVSGERRWSDPDPTNKVSPFSTGKLFCSVLHDDSLPVKSINWIFLQGWDANAGNYVLGWFRATPCVSFWGTGGGGTCGTVQSTGGTFSGAVDLSIDPSGTFFHSASVDSRDYPYVFVEVPADGGGAGVSSLRGLVWGT